MKIKIIMEFFEATTLDWEYTQKVIEAESIEDVKSRLIERRYPGETWKGDDTIPSSWEMIEMTWHGDPISGLGEIVVLWLADKPISKEEVIIKPSDRREYEILQCDVESFKIKFKEVEESDGVVERNG